MLSLLQVAVHYLRTVFLLLFLYLPLSVHLYMFHQHYFQHQMLRYLPRRFQLIMLFYLLRLIYQVQMNFFNLLTLLFKSDTLDFAFAALLAAFFAVSLSAVCVDVSDAVDPAESI